MLESMYKSIFHYHSEVHTCTSCTCMLYNQIPYILPYYTYPFKKNIFHADKLNFIKNKQGRIKIDYCKDCKEPFGLMRECVFFLFCVKYTCTCRNGILVKIINATEKILFVFECVNLTDYSTCIYFLKGIDIFIQL